MVYITTPAVPSCFVAFFSDPYSYFKIFIPLVCVLFINPLMDYGFLLLIMKTVVNSVILHSA